MGGRSSTFDELFSLLPQSSSATHVIIIGLQNAGKYKDIRWYIHFPDYKFHLCITKYFVQIVAKQINFGKTEGAIKNGQSRDTVNIDHRTKKKTTTQYRKSNRWTTRTTHKSLGLTNDNPYSTNIML
jgi:hypothetical protein